MTSSQTAVDLKFFDLKTFSVQDSRRHFKVGLTSPHFVQLLTRKIAQILRSTNTSHTYYPFHPHMLSLSHTHTLTHLHTYVHTNTITQRHTLTSTHSHTLVHTRTHTYTHTRTHALEKNRMKRKMYFVFI